MDGQLGITWSSKPPT